MEEEININRPFHEILEDIIECSKEFNMLSIETYHWIEDFIEEPKKLNKTMEQETTKKTNTMDQEILKKIIDLLTNVSKCEAANQTKRELVKNMKFEDAAHMRDVERKLQDLILENKEILFILKKGLDIKLDEHGSTLIIE